MSLREIPADGWLGACGLVQRENVRQTEFTVSEPEHSWGMCALRLGDGDLSLAQRCRCWWNEAHVNLIFARCSR